MESPLKDIVTKYPVVIKPYKPEPSRPANQNEQDKV